MGYAQRVTVKDEQGRITSSWLRVRIVVPDVLWASLPPPYTGHKNLTKEVRTDREHAEWTARFLAIIDKAKGWDTWHDKLAWLDGLRFEDKLREGPALLGNFDGWLDQIQGITPAWKRRVTSEPVTFKSMIGL